VQGEILEALRKNAHFEEVASVPAPNGKKYIIFERASPFNGLHPVTGMAPIEGPYPQWNMGAVEWGLFPSTQLELMETSQGKARLEMYCKTDMPGETMTVSLNDKLIYTYTFPKPEDFYEIDVPLELADGKNKIKLEYSKGVANEARPMAVLFQKLRVNLIKK
jgi:hypothetical protein